MKQCQPYTKPTCGADGTHMRNTVAVMSNNRTTNPMINGILFFDRKPSIALSPCGSGSTKLNFRPTISAPLGGLLGSKQYCLKHVVQKEERAIGGVTLKRPRSSAAHWRHLPKFASGVVALGVKPELTLACTWSRKTDASFGV